MIDKSGRIWAKCYGLDRINICYFYAKHPSIWDIHVFNKGHKKSLK